MDGATSCQKIAQRVHLSWGFFWPMRTFHHVFGPKHGFLQFRVYFVQGGGCWCWYSIFNPTQFIAKSCGGGMRFKFTPPFGWDFLQSSVGCLVSSQFNGGESSFSRCCLDGVNGSVGRVFQNMIFRGSVDTWITARVGSTKRGMVRRGGDMCGA